MQFLIQSAGVTVKLGPFVDSGDAVTPETGLAIAQADIRLSKNGGNYAQTHNAAGASHDENGWYGVPLDTDDTDTLGRLVVAVYESGALPVWREFYVVTASEALLERLIQSTAVTVKVGPFVDFVDGVTPETGLAIAQADIRLSKNGGNFAQTDDASGAAHDENGWYDVPLSTGDTDTLGRLVVAIYEAGALPMWREFIVVEPGGDDRYWIGGGAGNWNDATRWATESGGVGPASVPGPNNDVHLDGNGLGDCRLNAAIDVKTIAAVAAYTGTLDGATDNLDHAISGDATLACARVDMGDGTWTVGGNWDHDDVTTFNGNASTLVQTGVGKTFTGNSGNSSNKLNNVTFSGSGTMQNGNRCGGVLRVTGTLDTNGNTWNVDGAGGAGDVQVPATGLITGTGTLLLTGNGSSQITEMDGVIDVAVLKLRRNFTTYSIVAGKYDSASVIFAKQDTNGQDSTLRLGAGTYRFTGNVQYSDDGATGVYTIDDAANNPNLIFEGNVSRDVGGGGTIPWSKGTGTITLSDAGSGTQTIDFGGEAVETVAIDDTGATKQLTGALNCASLDARCGTFDPNGQNIAIVGASTINCGIVMTAAGLAGIAWTVGGNGLINGAPGILKTLNPSARWDYDVVGTNIMAYVNIAYCNADGGTELQAWNSADGGNNSNVVFPPITPDAPTIGSISNSDLTVTVAMTGVDGTCYVWLFDVDGNEIDETSIVADGDATLTLDALGQDVTIVAQNNSDIGGFSETAVKRRYFGEDTTVNEVVAAVLDLLEANSGLTDLLSDDVIRRADEPRSTASDKLPAMTYFESTAMDEPLDGSGADSKVVTMAISAWGYSEDALAKILEQVDDTLHNESTTTSSWAVPLMRRRGGAAPTRAGQYSATTDQWMHQLEMTYEIFVHKK